jgi:hypothetical protein
MMSLLLCGRVTAAWLLSLPGNMMLLCCMLLFQRQPAHREELAWLLNGRNICGAD